MLVHAPVAEIDRAYLRRLEFGRKLTGRTALAWFVVGFGVMFAANFALIYYSLSTLHGEETENSYDASQVYNQRIAAARAQDKLGWTVNVTTRQENGGAHIVADIRDAEGALVPGLDVHARLIHPFDRGCDRNAVLMSDGGDYEGFAADLKGEKWTLDIEAKANGERKFFSENRLLLNANTE